MDDVSSFAMELFRKGRTTTTPLNSPDSPMPTSPLSPSPGNNNGEEQQQSSRPRSRTISSIGNTLSRISFRAEPSPTLEIGRPTNFQHNVKVRQEADGTLTGMPDEYVTKLLKQVKKE